jgi:hypothetical protein
MAAQSRFYRARQATGVSATSLFFYHLPKCTSMSLYVAAHFA